MGNEGRYFVRGGDDACGVGKVVIWPPKETGVRVNARGSLEEIVLETAPWLVLDEF